MRNRRSPRVGVPEGLEGGVWGDRLGGMKSQFTAIVKKDGAWWVGWIEEVPGVNAQEKTKAKLMASLKEVLAEALEFNRVEARKLAKTGFSEEFVTV